MSNSVQLTPCVTYFLQEHLRDRNDEDQNEVQMASRTHCFLSLQTAAASKASAMSTKPALQSHFENLSSKKVRILDAFTTGADMNQRKLCDFMTTAITGSLEHCPELYRYKHCHLKSVALVDVCQTETFKLDNGCAGDCNAVRHVFA